MTKAQHIEVENDEHGTLALKAILACLEYVKSVEWKNRKMTVYFFNRQSKQFSYHLIKH